MSQLKEVVGSCDYCGADADGFVVSLPRDYGSASLSIHEASLYGYQLQIVNRGSSIVSSAFSIKFCPMCGTPLGQKK